MLVKTFHHTSLVWPQVPCTVLWLLWSSAALWWSVLQTYAWLEVQGRSCSYDWEQQWSPPSSLLLPRSESPSAGPLEYTGMFVFTGPKSTTFHRKMIIHHLLSSKGQLMRTGLPSRPASCSWILSISMGVVTMTWHIPAQHPANISLTMVSLPLETYTHVDRVSKRK